MKAVPKASVATSERSIKKINAEPVREERRSEESSGTYANPIFRQDERPKRKKTAVPAAEKRPRQAEKPAAKDVDFDEIEKAVQSAVINQYDTKTAVPVAP